MKGIYCYIDKKNGEVVYIGKDSNIDKNKRHKDHMMRSKYDAQQFNRVLQNNPDRYSYHVLKQGDFNDNLLNALEILYIRRHNSKFNYTKGGEGVTGYIHTEDTLRKMRKNHWDCSGENNPMWGKHHSEDTRRKIRENMPDMSGENHPGSKYTLWDNHIVHFHKSDMFTASNKEGLNPLRCFNYKFEGYYVPIGGFNEFISIEIIDNIVREELEGLY